MTAIPVSEYNKCVNESMCVNNYDAPVISLQKAQLIRKDIKYIKAAGHTNANGIPEAQENETILFLILIRCDACCKSPN